MPILWLSFPPHCSPITRNVKRATRSKDSSSAPAASPMGYNAALPRRVVREELSSRPGTPSLPLWARAPSPDWEVYHCVVASNVDTNAPALFFCFLLNLDTGACTCVYIYTTALHLQRAPAYGFTIPPRPDDGVDKRKKVMGMHIDDLERAYFDSRVRCMS